MNSHIVLGMAFGDEGKGVTTDYLASYLSDPLVVRFSGGQQAGHAVKIGNDIHVHSNYGSGALRGVPSYFTEHTCVHLSTICNERDKLRKLGKDPLLVVHPLTKLTTPYDVLSNRLGSNKHSTVGLGIGTTMRRNETPYKLHAIDLLHKDTFLRKLEAIKSYYTIVNNYNSNIRGLNQVDLESEEFKKSMTFFMELVDNFSTDPLFQIQDYSYFKKYNNIIYEGSQGILLDMDHGIFPDVTYSNTTCKNALSLAVKYLNFNLNIYYVTRAYQTRHGNGWMSNENKITLVNNENEINTPNDWQGAMRVGELDYDLLNHSLRIDKLYHTNWFDLRKRLVVTCMDQVDYSIDYTKFDTEFVEIYENYSPESKTFKSIKL